MINFNNSIIVSKIKNDVLPRKIKRLQMKLIKQECEKVTKQDIFAMFLQISWTLL